LIKEAENIPELPNQKVERYINQLKIKRKDALVLTSQKELANYFEEFIDFGIDVKNGVSGLINELPWQDLNKTCIA